MLQEYLDRLNFPQHNDTISGSFWTFEKTPNYMIWPHVPPAIIETCPWKPKILIVLRNPVDRLYSQYQMQFMQRENIAELEATLDTELTLLRRFHLSDAPNASQWQLHGLREGETFEPSTISPLERDEKDSIRFRGFGNHGAYPRYLQRGMYVYQLKRWLKYFRLNTELLVLPHEQLRQDMSNVWRTILEFLGAPFYELPELTLNTIYRPALIDKIVGEDMPPPKPMSNSTRQFLDEFFRPYNRLLVDLLGKEWEGIWDGVQ
jgi:hypothetical protein